MALFSKFRRPNRAGLIAGGLAAVVALTGVGVQLIAGSGEPPPDEFSSGCTTNTSGYCTVQHNFGSVPSGLTVTLTGPLSGVSSLPDTIKVINRRATEFTLRVLTPFADPYVGAVTFDVSAFGTSKVRDIEDTDLGIIPGTVSYDGRSDRGSNWIGCTSCGVDSGNNSYTYASRAKAYAEIRFTGAQARVFGVREPGGGIVNASLDGSPPIRVSTYAKAQIPALLYTTSLLSEGDHVIRFTLTGERDKGATSTLFSLDRAEVYSRSGLSTSTPTPTPTATAPDVGTTSTLTPVPDPTLTSSPSPTPSPTGTPGVAGRPLGSTGNWDQIFNDEFNDTNLDLTKWLLCNPSYVSSCVPYNSEQQHYNQALTGNTNVVESGGQLHLKATKIGGTINSGMISTGPNVFNSPQPGYTPFMPTYGFYEIRAKVPAGKGFWPSAWMLPDQAAHGAWPNSGEYDVFEIPGNDPTKYHYTAHWGTTGSGACGHPCSNQIATITNAANAFHVFGFSWHPDGLRWYVDGVQKGNTITDPSAIKNYGFYLMANLAVGGTWPPLAGGPDSTTPFPSQMDIDYIRFWQKESTTTPTPTPTPTVTPTSTPTSPPPPGGRPSLPGTILSGLPWRSGGTADTAQSLTNNQAFGTWRGKPIDVMLTFTSRNNGWGPITAPSYIFDRTAGWAGTPVISQPLFPSNAVNLSACASGAYNANWRAFGSYMVQRGRPKSIVRLGWEFNGTFMYWYGSNTENWKNCFRQAATSIRATDPQVLIDWTINAHGTPAAACGGDSWNCYPGDEYVDIVGIDNYDHYPPSPNQSAWNSMCNGKEGPCYMANFARQHGKWLGVGEWGVVSKAGVPGGKDNPFYIQKMWEFFQANKDILAYEIYFNDCAQFNVMSDIFKGCGITNPKAGAMYNSLY